MARLITILLIMVILLSCSRKQAADERRRVAPRPEGVPAAPVYQNEQGILTNLSPEKPARQKAKRKKAAVMTTRRAPQSPDSGRIEAISSLRSSNLLPDMNEPLNRRSVIAPMENGAFPTVVELSRESLFHFQADNDILDNTDRFYTNGIRFDLVAPFLNASPTSYLLVPYWHQAINSYGVCLVQNMYTPSTTKVGGILYGDRPYAAYLYIGFYKITSDKPRGIRLSSELQAGVIGPASLGEYVQKSFHNTVPTNNEPLGWEYQVQNDVLLNYQVALEKGLVATKAAEIVAGASGTLGTVYTNLAGEVVFRTGRFNPYFVNLGVSKESYNRRHGLRNTQVFLFMKMSGKLVGYDATLQGGMFNHSSVYTIPADEVSRLLFTGSAGLTFSYGGFRVNLEQFLQSPEFHEGWWHKWMSLGVTAAL